MFKRILILSSFAFLPVAAMGNSISSNDEGTQTLNVQAGQGGQLSVTVPSSSNAQRSVQAPYALTGSSATDTQPEYRQIVAGQGGLVMVQTN